MAGFAHDIAGGGGDLIIDSVQSPNYVPGVSGWQIRQDGSAEFNDVTIRGQFVDTTSLSYSGTPAAGNLVQSSGFTTNTTDGFGNHVLAGQATYGSTVATAVQAGEIGIYSGSLAGGWTLEATITTDISGDLLLAVTGGGSITFASNAVAGSDLSVSGTFSAPGSSTQTAQPAGVPTGGPNGAVFAGHTHDFDGHTHPM